ncbi:hypothetical protein PF005_g26605 [Phytophthora fragariae]|uniref:Temptin Cys/Cys disulfide domain-containing protein n=1 Tax=Phytophthora fragariae TaxID=53985 RepID=A0A6A4BRF4_9STRA|nr:hypothetical protein PF003_g21833 [Phytophthora fragariae]KAE8922424.1 hypothetical protein PF009_g27315 [Phytophthora fragariae]KAE9070755.1 hypothetical protein PF010_g26143 [Phytophthora fragariae]KAE9071301.1 hypothetical protein PF007_g26613 [Phytophthora fragariae]KAE9086215.1 hypothetical protein PF006_g26071 [Phytophthora fragariae]
MKVSIVSATQIATLLALAAIRSSGVEASKKFVKMLPNGGNVPDTPAIGHPDGTGKSAATNAFGDAFAAAGYKWTKELCQADTDGDGQTNGQELGDPCCEWDKDTNPVVLWTTGVSHPDEATKKADPSLWAGKCGLSTSSTASTSGAANTATTSSKESASASSGSAATNTPSTTGAPSSTSVSTPSTTGAPSSASSSSTSRSLGSTASSANSRSDDSGDSSMHTHVHDSSHSASTTGSLNASGSSSSVVDVGSPIASSASGRSSIRSASSASSAKATPSSSSSSSNTPATSAASALSPMILTMAGVVATMAFLS